MQLRAYRQGLSGPKMNATTDSTLYLNYDCHLEDSTPRLESQPVLGPSARLLRDPASELKQRRAEKLRKLSKGPGEMERSKYYYHRDAYDKQLGMDNSNRTKFTGNPVFL